MAREQAHDTLVTKLTIIQLRAELLQRQARHRVGLTAAERQWLESAMTTIVDATRQIGAVLAEEESAALPRTARRLCRARMNRQIRHCTDVPAAPS